MKAWLLESLSDLTKGSASLKEAELQVPIPGDGELLIRIKCCGICHTEMDEIEGRLSPSVSPVVPGHQVVGVVEQLGSGCRVINKGDRVGIAWIFSACGNCEFCLSGQENLCSKFKGTGKDAHGGYAEYMVVNEAFAFRLPDTIPDMYAAPLLCAGAIGYRSLKLSALRDGETLGLSGFGASGHLVLKTAKALFPKSEILVFARSSREREFARTLGATWAGDTDEKPPMLAQAIIDTTPVWSPVIHSMANLKPGGRLVINAIRKESIDQSQLLGLSYTTHLWMEKEIKSVANITRDDVIEFLSIAAKHGIRADIETYPFESANQALFDLKNLPGRGAKVLVM